jgi:hypothetical protein
VGDPLRRSEIIQQVEHSEPVKTAGEASRVIALDDLEDIYGHGAQPSDIAIPEAPA